MVAKPGFGIYSVSEWQIEVDTWITQMVIITGIDRDFFKKGIIETLYAAASKTPKSSMEYVRDHMNFLKSMALQGRTKDEMWYFSIGVVHG